jgi:hypothetical protein
MAEQRRSFPMLSPSHWWKLRKKFKQSIPGTVTANYLATVLEMQESSARTNVLIYLRDLGLVDEEGKTLDRSRKWRDDDQYKDVCQDIVQAVYPQELLDAAPDPNEDRQPALRWFANHTGADESAVRKMANFYALVMEADASKEIAQRRDDKPKGRETSSPNTGKIKRRPGEVKSRPKERQPSNHNNNFDGPELRINLQIHISSDATPDQIDQIFASMAKHIYRNVQ